MIRRKLLAGFVVVSLILLVHICLAADKIEAEEAMIYAKDDLSSAYVAVAEAEAAGADVSQFLERLNAAGSLLADAYNAHRTLDFDEAYSCAVQCRTKVDGITSEASTLKIAAEEIYRNRLLVTAGESCAVLGGLFLLGFWGWRTLRRRFIEKILQMKPEVGES